MAPYTPTPGRAYREAQAANNFREPLTATEAEKPESEISCSMSGLEEAISNLENEARLLHHDLSPVLAPVEEDDPGLGALAAKDRDVRAPLTRRIDAALDRVISLRLLVAALRTDLRI